jgi:Lrp/AsnC family transcriptional regulator, leucine-responsive regulatory protein
MANFVAVMRRLSNDLPMDATDRAILRELQRDGRIPNATLAERVSLSPSPCLRRVKRLEADGTIRGYQAVLDRQKLKLGLTVFTEVKSTGHSPELAAGFERAVSEIDEIVACYIVSGSGDFLLEIALDDVASFERFYLDKVLTLPGVYDTESKFVIRTMKAPGPLPVRD